MATRPKVIVDGYFNQNLGDDIFFTSLFERYKQLDFTVLCPADYEKSLARYDNVRMVKKSLPIRAVGKISRRFGYSPLVFFSKGCDIAVLIGGSIFIEPNMPDIIAKRSTPLYIIGSNYGPAESPEYEKNIERYFAFAKDVCLRDESSYQKFSHLPNVRMAPDAVFALRLPKEYLDVKEEDNTFISVINLAPEYRPKLAKYREAYENYLLKEIMGVLKAGGTVSLASFCKGEGDEEAVMRLLRQVPLSLRERVGIIMYRGDITLLLREIARSSCVIGSRFHSIVLGLLMGKSVIPIAYSEKTVDMLNGLNRGCMRIEDLSSTVNTKGIRLSEEELRVVRHAADGQFRELDKAVERLASGESDEKPL